MQFAREKGSMVTWLAGALLIAGALAMYWNSLDAPFFFDDFLAVLENPSIRSLRDPSAVLSPPSGGAGGRPVVNLSLAVNYAMGGTSVTGYHVLNILLHAGATLALFGCVRRTLALPQFAPWVGDLALPLAWTTTAIWLTHPLQTESVTCVIQRTELLVGLFFLLTLYCFIRAAETSSKAWAGLAIGAAFLGMGSKEVMVSAPLVIFLYDRTFLAGSFAEAWRRRRGLHLGLAAAWLLLGFLVIRQGGARADAAGFGLGVTWWSYALKQCEAIIHYLWLTIWPHPLVVFYGVDVITDITVVWPQLLVLVALGAAVVYALWRHPIWGFLGFWFFAILAPSSSVVPLVTQTMSEHRMYLPLVAPLALGALVLFRGIGRTALPVMFCAALALGAISARRNVDYRSDLVIWTDTVAKAPNNARARINLGAALKKAGDREAARKQFEAALRLDPNNPEALNNLAAIFLEGGQPTLAIEPCRVALRLKPNFALAHNNLGTALVQTGQVAEGIFHLQTAATLRPEFAEAHCNLASALLQVNEVAQAIQHGQTAVRLRPDYAMAYFNLATALLQARETTQAVHALEETVRIDPNFADAQSNLGGLYFQAGDPARAIPCFEAALRARPEHLNARNNLASALVQTGRTAEGIAQYERVIRADPSYAEAYANLGFVLIRVGRIPEAIAALETALRLQPNHQGARDALAHLRSTTNNP